jgi:hypothetical protein
MVGTSFACHLFNPVHRRSTSIQELDDRELHYSGNRAVFLARNGYQATVLFDV